jgi:hypothetical protein
MIVTEQFYAVECDRCGEIHEGGDFSFFADDSQAIEDAEGDEWIEKGGKHYCTGCYVRDEETDEDIVKPPYPEVLLKLRRFIEKTLKCPTRCNEEDDRFIVSFYTRGGEKRLKPYDHAYITDLLGSSLKLFEYKDKERISNAECIITIKK